MVNERSVASRRRSSSTQDTGSLIAFSVLMLRAEWFNDYWDRANCTIMRSAWRKRGVELADNESSAHMALGFLYLDSLRSFDLALRHMERAIEINPANPWNQADFGNLLCQRSRRRGAGEATGSARRADPYFGPSWYWSSLGRAQFVLRRDADALADFDRGDQHQPTTSPMMAGCCATSRHCRSRSGIGDADA